MVVNRSGHEQLLHRPEKGGFNVFQSSSYERLGGASATAAVIEHFPVVQNPIASQPSARDVPAEPLVLAVDDDPATLRLFALELGGEGFRVIAASNGEQALAIAETQRPDVVLLDVVMPGMTGYEVLRSLRERKSMPVIFVTALHRECDKVRGLELGADDYIVKPFGADELAARIRAVLRRAADVSFPDQVVWAADVAVDLDRRLAQRNGELIPLTRTEWQLLQHLAVNAGKVILGDTLLSNVWGPEYSGESQFLRVWISRLRHKLEADPKDPTIIKTLSGIGYMFQPNSSLLRAAGDYEPSVITETDRVAVGPSW